MIFIEDTRTGEYGFFATLSAAFEAFPQLREKKKAIDQHHRTPYRRKRALGQNHGQRPPYQDSTLKLYKGDVIRKKSKRESEAA
jgi:hypothetical protein